MRAEMVSSGVPDSRTRLATVWRNACIPRRLSFGSTMPPPASVGGDNVVQVVVAAKGPKRRVRRQEYLPIVGWRPSMAKVVNDRIADFFR